jgi:adenylate cyclase
MAQTTTAASLGAKIRLRVMIVTGMVMFVFISMHLANLALGLISLQTMEDWRGALSGVWSDYAVLKFLLQVSLILHFIVALISLYLRNTLKVPAYDMLQMIAGVFIIPLLGLHVFGVMAVKELGLEPTYALVLGQFWIVSPLDGLQQVVMLVVAWVHGAIGVYTWLRARDSSARVMNLFYPFIVALPILAMLGYVEAGRQMLPVSEGGGGVVLVDDPNRNGPTVEPAEIPRIIAKAKQAETIATRVSLGLVVLALLARWLRVSLSGRRTVHITYEGRRAVSFEAQTGLTLLEMARERNLPHVNVCRGRGRCGTCRVRVLSKLDTLPPPDEVEASVLARWNAGPDERLACQLKPETGPVIVERVVAPDYSNLDDMRAKRDQTQVEAAT